MLSSRYSPSVASPLEHVPVVGAVQASARVRSCCGFGEMVLDVLHSGKVTNRVQDAWQIFR